MAEPIPVLEKKVWVTGDTHGRADRNWWQAARDVRNIARNSRITYPTGAELAAFKTFINGICQWDENTQAYTGTRTWLGWKLNLKAVSQLTHYVGDTTVEPVEILVKIVDHMSRDFKKIPPNDAEMVLIDAFVAATGNRNLGSGPYFGGVAGSELS